LLFTELVLTHYRAFALRGRYGELGGLPPAIAPPTWSPQDAKPSEEECRKAETAFRDALGRFTKAEGDVVAAYWSVTMPSGIVMTMRERGWFGNFLFGPTFAIHRATTWLTASEPHIAELLHHCDTLGNKAAQILTRTPRRVAMTWVFSLEAYLLGILEGRAWTARASNAPAPGETNGGTAVATAAGTPNGNAAADNSESSAGDEELIIRARTEIVEVEKYYDRAASNAARFLYFWGMFTGALLAAAAGVVVAVVLGTALDVIDLGASSSRLFFACYAAGALGAIVSVLTRMRSDRFAIDYEVGRTPAFLLGTFRPFLGAVFGLLIYFALQSELLQLRKPNANKEFFFFTFLAFAAGFSERLTQVILGGAERTVAGTLEKADVATSGVSTTTREMPSGEKVVTTHRSRTGV